MESDFSHLPALKHLRTTGLRELQNDPAKLCQGAHISRLSRVPPSRPSSPEAALQTKVLAAASRQSFQRNEVCLGPAHSRLPQDATETCEGDTSPRGPKLATGGGGVGGGWRPKGSASPRGSARRAGAFPDPRTPGPRPPITPQTPGARGAACELSVSPARSRPRRHRVPSARGREWRRPAAWGQFRPGPPSP